jgi:hypothetical protein
MRLPKVGRTSPSARGLLAALASSLLLHAQLAVPQPGIVRFADGSVRAVRGIPANLMVHSLIASADLVSFSDVGGLISSNGLIRLLRIDGKVLGEYQSGEPRPLLNIDAALQSAAVWLPSKHLLLHWDGKAFAATPVDDSSFGGGISFVRLASDTTAEFFASLTDSAVARVSVALPSGRLVNSEIQPGVYGKVFLQHAWILSQNERGLLAETANGTRQMIPLSQQPLPAGDLTIERMSTDWLHVSSRSIGASWAIYLSAAKLSVSLLPPPVREDAK